MRPGRSASNVGSLRGAFPKVRETFWRSEVQSRSSGIHSRRPGTRFRRYGIQSGRPGIRFRSSGIKHGSSGIHFRSFGSGFQRDVTRLQGSCFVIQREDLRCLESNLSPLKVRLDQYGRCTLAGDYIPNPDSDFQTWQTNFVT